MDQLRVFLTAVMFLTRLPCPSWVGHDADYLARSTVYFPIIGLGVGLFGGLFFWLTHLFWPPLIALIAALAAMIWLTGAFHEDGLADTFDGIGGGWTPDEMLGIMKDSRLGTYGAVALVLVLIAKLGALQAVAPSQVIGALVVGHVLGRWSSLPLIYRYTYVRESSATGKPFAASVTLQRLVVGTILAIGFTALSIGWKAVPAWGVALGGTAIAGWYFQRQLGGITGDCLGATNQLVELAIYLTLAMHLEHV